MADNDIDIRVRVDAQGAIQVFDQLGNKVADFERKAEGGSSGLTKFQAGIISLNQALGLAQTAFRAFSGAFATFVNFAERGDAVNDAAEGLDRLAAKAGTTAEIILSKMSPALNDSVDQLNLMQTASKGLIKGLNPEMFDEIAFAAKRYADAVGADATETTNKFIDAIARGREKQLEMLGLLKDGKIVIEGYTQAQLDTMRANDGVGDSIERNNSRWQNLYDALAKAIDGSQLLKQFINLLNNELYRLAAQVVDSIRGLIAFADVLLKKVNSAAEQTADTFAVLGEVIGQISSGSLPSFQKAVDAVAKSKLEALEKSALRVGETFSMELPKKVKEGADKISKEFEALAQKTGTQYGSIFTDIIADWFGGVGSDQIMAEWEALGRQQVQAGKTTADEYVEQWKNALDAQADAFKRNVQADIAEMDRLADEQKKLEETIAGYVSDAMGGINGALSGDKGAIKQSLGDLGGRGGAALGGRYLGPIGAVVGQELGRNLGEAVYEGIEHVFGGRDAQGKVRDSMDKFFADIFKDNPAFVLIGDELKKITDLNFMRGTNAFSDGSFDDVLQGMSASAQNSFDAMGLAFSEMITGSTEQAGQLAAILADNVGGSLNNLQVLVGATGKSFEDMRNIVVEAFLDGELSAGKAQAALAGIQQISEKGIPGALGDVSQAFHNLQQAGVQGGRYLVDALQDIGFEAKELGHEDFAFIQEQLIAAGNSVEDVQKLFNALASSGIDDVKELTSATNEQLIGVVASLESLSFPFAEASKSMGDLISKVENLPDEIRTKVKIDVETNWGDAPTAVKEAAQLPSGQFILDGRA